MNPAMIVTTAAATPLVVHVAVAIAGMHSVRNVDTTAAATSLALDNFDAAAVDVWCRRRAPSSVSTLLQVFPIASSIVGSNAAAGRPIHVVAVDVVHSSSILTI